MGAMEPVAVAIGKVKKAQEALNGITAGYDKLAKATNPEDAKQAYEQAVASLAAARKEYEDALSGK